MSNCESFGEFINSAYPQFLKKFGIDNVAGKAEGSRIIDSSGKRYLDFVSGYGIHNIGHNHPAIVAELIDHFSSGVSAPKPFISEVSVRLAERLSEITPGGEKFVFLCNSGSEAVDTSIKLARLYRRKSGIIAFEGSFHGYSLGALSVSGIPAFKRPFQPLIGDVKIVPYSDLGALVEAIDPNTAAIVVELIQHEAGVVAPGKGYFQEMSQICDEKGILLIVDEIKTGCGKTGFMTLSEQYGLIPDMILLGKSLGGGIVPAGAVIANRKMMKKFSLSFPMSASSYAWNALVCRASLATIDILMQPGMMNRVPGKGIQLLDGISRIRGLYPEIVKRVTGVGLLIGVETASLQLSTELCREMISREVLVLPAFGKGSVVMIEPPLVITDAEISYMLNIMEISIAKVGNNGKGN